MAGTKEGAAKRQRNGSNETKDQALSEGIQGGDPRNPNKRRERIPMQKGQNLEVPGVTLEKDKYHYHWFTEKPHRPGTLDKAKAAFYEHVHDHEGSVVSRPSGAGVTYLMKLPIEYWQEDLQTKRERVKKTLEDQTSLGPNEYAPTKNNREGGESSMVDKTESDNPYAS